MINKLILPILAATMLLAGCSAESQTIRGCENELRDHFPNPSSVTFETSKAVPSTEGVS